MIDRSKLRSKLPIFLGTGRWHFILFDSDGESRGEQMASDNDVCEKGKDAASPEAFICRREFFVVLQCGRATFPQMQLDSRRAPIILKSNWIAKRMIVVADLVAQLYDRKRDGKISIGGEREREREE